ncbi:MAG: translocation/assembly module TamB domain-containing protein [Chitinophagaceae bacterium]
MKKFFSILGIILFLLIVALGIAMLMLKNDKYQNILLQKATTYLSEKLKTKVTVDHIHLSFFNTFTLEGVYVEDEKKDTLLYVRNLNVRTSELLRNYWNHETYSFRNIKLHDIVVRLDRPQDSSRWNFDFIAEAFSSPSQDSTQIVTENKEKTNTKNEFPFSLEHVEIDGARFAMIDRWNGENFIASLNELQIDINKLDIEKTIFELEKLAIHTLAFKVEEYEGGKPKRKFRDSSDWGTPFNPNLASININQIDLKESSFAYLDGNGTSPKHEFDERNLQINQINLSLLQTKIVADTIFSQIENLTAKERCGLEVSQLKAQVKLSQIESVLTDLILKTPHSLVQDQFEMHYRNFHDFENFIDAVSMKAKLSKSKISSKDIAYFAPILLKYPIDIEADGEAHGTLPHLYANNLKLHNGRTSFVGDAEIKGLPDIDKTHFWVHAKQLNTTGNDINRLVPQTRVDALAWKDLDQISYQGIYEGTIQDIHCKGLLKSSLGHADVDLYMDLEPKITTYKAYVNTNQFLLGKLIKQKDIGPISFNGNIEGKGFDLATLNAKVNAEIKQFSYQNQAYEKIHVNGIVANKKFDGIFVSQDPKLSINFNGKLDLSQDQPVYNFSSRFIKFNLKKLGITDKEIIGSGYAKLQFKGDHIDNFQGQVDISNLQLEYEGKRNTIENFSLSSTTLDKSKMLTLKSDILDAEVNGQYNFSALPDAFQMYLHYYLPQYIKKPKDVKNQQLTFTANLKNADPILQTFFPLLSDINGSYLSGELNTNNQKLSIDFTIPKLSYEDIHIDSIVVVSAGDFSSLDMNAITSTVSYKDNAIIPSMQLATSMSNDTASLSLNTQSINNLFGEASLHCKATALNNSLFVKLLRSEFYLKNDPWQISSPYDLVFGKTISIQDLVMENGAQKISINTLNKEIPTLLVNLKDIDLEKISNYANFDGVTAIGRIQGDIHVEDFDKNPIIKSTLFSNQDVRFNQDTLGLVKANFIYDTKIQRIQIEKPSGIFRNDDKIEMFGVYNLSDSVVNMQAHFENAHLSLISPYIKDFVENLKGEATGIVFAQGKLPNPNVAGKVVVHDAGMKVIYLGTTYSIEKSEIEFTNNKIKVAPTLLKDEREGNYTGTLKGQITHTNFSKFFLDLDIESQNLLCLNTKPSLNELFYGYITAKADMNLSGFVDDLELEINCKPLKGSVFYLTSGASGDASSYDYVTFKEYGNAELHEKESKKNYAKINFNIETTPDAEVHVVLDQNTNEEIVAQGNGDIRLFIDLGNEMNMFGNYTVTNGKYFFNFRGVFNKQFDIEEGGKLIWNGDPLDAQLDLNATYKLPKSLPLKPLVNDIWDQMDESDQEEAKHTYPTYIKISLSKSLTSPEIKFDIVQPENKALSSTGYTRLEQIRNNEKELVTQAAVLLLLEQFKQPEGLSSNAYGQTVISTVSDVVTSAISNELTNQFQKLTGLDKVNLNVGYNNSLNSLDNSNSNQISLNVQTSLFKDRVIVDLGNSVDINKNASGNTSSNFNLFGDFKAQYLITDDGRIRLNAFRTTNQDLENKNYSRSGIGISYKKAFNSFADLFKSKKKQQKVNKTS